jgi:poly(3-hydroxybutyrate) depolymerase
MAGRPTVVVGFSNGSFMAQRLACDAPEVKAIVSLAGGDPMLADACTRTDPVAIVHVHGSADRVVPLGGGHVLSDPSRPAISAAEDVLRRWGTRNGCDLAAGFVDRGRRDLSTAIAGDETRIRALQGCRAPVELWVVEGGAHLDVASPSVARAAVESVL